MNIELVALSRDELDKLWTKLRDNHKSLKCDLKGLTIAANAFVSQMKDDKNAAFCTATMLAYALLKELEAEQRDEKAVSA